MKKEEEGDAASSARGLAELYVTPPRINRGCSFKELDSVEDDFAEGAEEEANAGEDDMDGDETAEPSPGAFAEKQHVDFEVEHFECDVCFESSKDSSLYYSSVHASAMLHSLVESLS
jgi:hypothetical protein